MRVSKLTEWFGSHTPPFSIAGPCSAESEAQVLQSARALARLPHVRLMRAGLWKPRTRPGGFEGVGAAGIPWMVRAREETGLGIATEVATPAHVELALDHGFDLVWLGARTTANPFAVQALADALHGSDAVVAIKNPINSDLGLWRGALERISAAGVQRVILIHRGFTRYEPSRYRNPPLWTIPIEMMRLHSELPMLCDPSHIAGERALVEEVAAAATGMGMDGLIVEVHPEPRVALSDAGQQLDLDAFAAMLSRLVMRTRQGTDTGFEQKLEAFRERIDVLDEALLDVLARRMEVVREIGRGKADAHVTALQIERWNRVVEGTTARAEQRGLRAEYVHALFEVLHAEAVAEQVRMWSQSHRPERSEDGRG